MTLGLVCGCAALTLNSDEISFLAEVDPWGLILFRRNVEDAAQLAALTAQFRQVVNRPDAPVLIDQEGGRVQRLRPPQWPDYPSAATYGQCGSAERAIEAAQIGGRLIADDLWRAGITIDCAPVLDRPVAGSHDVIGNRAFGREVEDIVRLGRAFAEGLLEGGVLPVMKHAPGHGRAGVDSHLSLPVVETDAATLAATDFEPFRQLADLPIAMTAHVVYTALDPHHPATTSATIIATIIRGAIGFDGLLLSDDLSMEALKGTLGERAARARDAGCDVLLHCNGKLDEARAVAAAARPIRGGEVERRIAAAMGRVRPPVPFDRAAAMARLSSLVAQAPVT